MTARDDLPQYTADQLEAGVHNALRVHDMLAAADILECLIAVDIERGMALYDDLKFSLEFARRFTTE